jgi:hypothetical protein
MDWILVEIPLQIIETFTVKQVCHTSITRYISVKEKNVYDVDALVLLNVSLLAPEALTFALFVRYNIKIW